MSMNTERGIAVLARIEIARNFDGRHLWDQGEWAQIWNPELDDDGDILIDEETGRPLGYATCNTAHCAAGFALDEAKIKLDWKEMDEGGDQPGRWIAWHTLSGEQVELAACRWLGIEISGDGQADHWNYNHGRPYLFDPENSIDTMYHLMWDLMDHDEVPSVAALRALVQIEVGRRHSAALITGRTRLDM